MLLSIIIVSYNTKNLTLQTLHSVKTQIDRSETLKNHTEVFVVDNNSQDDSVAAVKELCKTWPIKLLVNQENLGFARANNQAIATAQGQYILLLNSDTIVHEHTLTKMIEYLEKNPHVGVLSASLINRDGTPQAQGGSFPTLFSIALHMLMIDDLPLVKKLLPSTQHTGFNVSDQQIRNKDWVGGTAMMVRKTVFDEVGLLDQNIFMYGEDVEFCMRARDHHWLIEIQPQAVITHIGSASSSSANAIMGEFKGYLYIWSKHKPLWQMSYLKFLLRSGCFLRVILFKSIINKPEKAKIYATIFKDMIK